MENSPYFKEDQVIPEENNTPESQPQEPRETTDNVIPENYY